MLPGTGPWSLVEVADTLGMSYDTVCRDVRRGILPARPATQRPGPRYVVYAEDLGRAGRGAYRTLAAPAPPPPVGAGAVS